MKTSVALTTLLFIAVSARPLLHFPNVDDGSFEGTFNGEVAIDEWYKKDDAGSTTAINDPGLPVGRGIDETEFTWQASHPLDTVRNGLITFFDNEGGGKLTYEAVASRCVPDTTFGRLDPAGFRWEYTWGKDMGSGSFVSAKMIVHNRQNGFFATFVSLSLNSGVQNMWTMEDFDGTTAVWTLANVFWVGVLGDTSDDTMGTFHFVNNDGATSQLNTGLAELIPFLTTPPPGAFPTITTWPDTGGERRSLNAWFNPTTEINEFLVPSIAVTDINIFHYLLTNGDPTSFPEVIFLQFGAGTSSSMKSAYLDETRLTLENRVVQHSTFDTMGPFPRTTPEAIDACTRTCVIIPQMKRGFKGFRNQKVSLKGRPSHIFNLLSDEHCQVNAKLSRGEGESDVSVIRQLGFRSGSDKILVGCDDTLNAPFVQVNNKSFSDEGEFKLSSGYILRSGDGDLTLTMPLYYFKLSVVQTGTPKCHVSFSVKHWRAPHESLPHGILGLTVHNIHWKTDRLFQGQWDEFRVSDIFSSDFKHNVYDATMMLSRPKDALFQRRESFISETY